MKSKLTGEPALLHRKIAILGFPAVGKTSLTNAFVSGTFSDTYDPTIENTHHKTIRFRRVHIETDIVDTAGMDEYGRLSRNASIGVNGYALVFSITSKQSFEGLKQINESLYHTLGDAQDVPRVLVGCMRDLSDQRQVSYHVSFAFTLSKNSKIFYILSTIMCRCFPFNARTQKYTPTQY